MNRIRLLPEDVANQIAAGEVVERPASAVKELVENSIDAEARRITIEIHAGGRSLIRVVDDGLGMSRDDALLCLERHATSKIQKAEDLSSIATMGFRGEALPSIASISRFSMVTREHDNSSGAGTQIQINAGRIMEVKEAGCAPGTTIEVRQMFFNLPARRKFLRSEETEASHIQHYLTLAALAFPSVAFTFIKDGRTVWQLPGLTSHDPAKNLRERFRAIHGGDDRLIEVNFTDSLESDSGQGGTDSDAGRFRLWGLMGAPGVSRSTREEQHLFVNRRPVENRGLNFALAEGYHTALMKGRYPLCCLFLEIHPSEVDVNIHPAKREVKFHREREVRQRVSHAVRQALLDYHQADKTPAQPPLEKAVPLPPHSEKPPALASSQPARPTAPESPAVTSRELPRLWAETLQRRPEPRVDSVVERRPQVETPSPRTDATQGPQRFSTPHAEASPAQPKSDAMPLLDVPLRIIGVVGRLYVLMESDRGLVLLDQHAAHERVLFEQTLRRLEETGTASSQRLLLPETIELTIRDAQFVRDQLKVLNRLGVELSEFGERTFLLDALPPFVKAADPRKFIRELIDEIKASGEGVNALRLGEDTVAKLVCRHAVKANDPLDGPELENLVRDLRHCAMPYTCPHGRPTLIEMNFRELEKKFGRVQ